TVLIEKVLDLGTMALLLFVLGQIFPELPESARYAALVSGVGLAIAVRAWRSRSPPGDWQHRWLVGSRSACRRSPELACQACSMPSWTGYRSLGSRSCWHRSSCGR